jgi:hypothetical protein
MNYETGNKRTLDHVSPATQRAQLGARIAELEANVNALLAKLDADSGTGDSDYADTLAVAEIDDTVAE